MSSVNVFFSNPVYISRKHKEFIKLLEYLEEQNGESYAVLSYLSSLHFPKSIIARFYDFADRMSTGKRDYLNSFDRMKKLFANHIKNYKYFVLYPKSIVERFICSGQIHSPYKFFASPAEISIIVNNIINLLEKDENFNIALTEETPPFIFVVKNENVIIDVKENIISQKIQGIAIRNQEIANYFREEFERMWNSKKTMNKKEDVTYYLKSRLNEQQHYGGIKIRKEVEL